MTLKLKDMKFVNANIILRLLQLFCTLNRKAPHRGQTSFNQNTKCSYFYITDAVEQLKWFI